MRTLHFFIVTCLLVTVIAPAAILILAIENEPRIVRQVSLSPEYIARAKQTIDTYRDQSNPEIATINILSTDIDIAANYLAKHLGKGSAKVSTIDGSALINLSIPLPEQFLNGYFNLQVTFAQTTWLPHPHSVQIGNLPLPNFVTNLLVSIFHHWLQESPELSAGIDIIEQIKISHHNIDVIYHWSANNSQKRKGIPILGKATQERLYRFNALLVKNSKANGNNVVTLSEILQPLIHHAAIHSTHGDALAENRAAILVTTFHALGFPLKLLLPEAANWPMPKPQKVTLDGRNDFAKHFMVSAAITAYADTQLSDAIGLYKEIEDLRDGSGFSFNDIAANRAGTLFGKKAAANQASARQLQQLIMSGLKDTDLMPPWLDLPEHMTTSEFQQRFGGINEPNFKQMAAEIEKRVAALHILRSD